MKQYESLENWKTEAQQKFGEDWKNWTFECDHCGAVQSGKILIEKGINEKEARADVYQKCFSCEGKSYGFVHSDTAILIDGELNYVFAFKDSQ